MCSLVSIPQPTHSLQVTANFSTKNAGLDHPLLQKWSAHGRTQIHRIHPYIAVVSNFGKLKDIKDSMVNLSASDFFL